MISSDQVFCNPAHCILSSWVAEPKREVRPDRILEAVGSREFDAIRRAASEQSHGTRVSDRQGLLLVANESDPRAGVVNDIEKGGRGLKVQHSSLVYDDAITGVDTDPGAAIAAARDRVKLADREPQPLRCARCRSRAAPSVLVQKLVEGRRRTHRLASRHSRSLLGRRDDDHLVATPPQSSARNLKHRGLTGAG